MTGRSYAIPLLLVLALTQLGCSALLRHKPARRDSPASSRSVVELQKRMNPWLLTDLLAEKLIVEIDWVEGLPPAPKALRALEDTLRKYGPSGRPFEIVLSDEIPRGEWEALHAEGNDMQPLVERYLDTDPHPSSEHALAYVLYLPYYKKAKQRHFGQRTSWLVERDGIPALVDGVMMFRESISKRGLLWITGNRIDRAVLVHEFGHLFGLVANPRHGVAGNPGHCTEVYCTMTPPGTRGYLANFIPGLFAARIPIDYCKKCRADMVEAKVFWAGQARRAPDYASRLVRRYHDRLANWLSTQWRRDRDGPAHARLESATTVYPTQAAYKVQLGFIAVQEDDRALARHLFLEAAADAGSVHLRNSARYLCGLGDYESALELLTRAEADVSDFVDEYARTDLAVLRRWALEGIGEPERALNEMETHYPEDTDVRIHLLGELGRWEEAEALIESVADSGDRQLRLGRLARRRGDNALAERLFEEVRESTLRRLESIPDPERDVDRMRRAIQLVALAEIHAELRDEKAARAALEPLSDLLTGNNAPIALMTRARVLTVLGDIEGAMEALSGLKLPLYAEQDPCIVFGRTALAEDPRFGERYPWCAGVR